MMQVGHNLVYSKERRLPSVGRPILLDQVAIDFPELTLIGIHIGVPWTDEMISMCWKHDNVYTAGDAYAPKHWPPQYVHYANSYGSHKVLFGTDWPVIDPERAVAEVAAHRAAARGACAPDARQRAAHLQEDPAARGLIDADVAPRTVEVPPSFRSMTMARGRARRDAARAGQGRRYVTANGARSYRRTRRADRPRHPRDRRARPAARARTPRS